jgi:hypothetical protein
MNQISKVEMWKKLNLKKKKSPKQIYIDGRHNTMS